MLASLFILHVNTTYWDRKGLDLLWVFFFLMGIQLFFILLSKILSNVGNARRYIKANYMEEGVCPDMITENCLFHLQIQNN